MNNRMAELLRAAFGTGVSGDGGYIHVYEWPECICGEDDEGNPIPDPACEAHTGQPTIVYETIPSSSVSDRVSTDDPPSVSHE